MTPIVYNRRNKKVFEAHELEMQVHPRQQPQSHQEGLGDIGANCGAAKGAACYLD